MSEFVSKTRRLGDKAGKCVSSKVAGIVYFYATTLDPMSTTHEKTALSIRYNVRKRQHLLRHDVYKQAKSRSLGICTLITVTYICDPVCTYIQSVAAKYGPKLAMEQNQVQNEHRMCC